MIAVENDNRLAPRFSARCPQCRQEVDQGPFIRDSFELSRKEGTLRFYCGACQIEWAPSEEELAVLAVLLRPGDSPFYF